MNPSSILFKKRVCVTGATGGLGRSLARAFAQEGCKLVLTARKAEALEALAAELEEAEGADVEVCAADLATDAGLKAVTDLMGALGGVDVLVNNAGIFPVASIGESTLADFDACMALNVRAPFALSKAVVERSLAHGHGWARIVNVGSSSAFGASPKTSVYCASKHALLGLSRGFFAELRGTNIRVYSVHPGSMQTPMGRLVPGQDYSTFLDPAGVAETIVWMLGREGNLVAEEVRLNRFTMR